MCAAMCSCGCLDRIGSIGATEGLYQDCNALTKVRKKWNLCCEENYCYFSISSNYRRIVLSLHNSFYIKKSKFEMWGAYLLYGNFSETFPSNGTGIFFVTENRNGIEQYHLQNTGKIFAFSRHEAQN